MAKRRRFGMRIFLKKKEATDAKGRLKLDMFRQFLYEKMLTEEFWKDYMATLSKAMKGLLQSATVTWKYNVIRGGRWWQRQEPGGSSAPSVLNSIGPHPAEKDGRKAEIRLYNMLHDLEISVTKATQFAGTAAIFYNVAPDMTEIGEAGLERSENMGHKSFEYWRSQEFGNQKFSGKHFLFDESSTINDYQLRPEDEAVFRSAMAQLTEIIQATIRKNNKK